MAAKDSQAAVMRKMAPPAPETECLTIAAQNGNVEESSQECVDQWDVWYDYCWGSVGNTWALSDNCKPTYEKFAEQIEPSVLPNEADGCLSLDAYFGNVSAYCT